MRSLWQSLLIDNKHRQAVTPPAFSLKCVKKLELAVFMWYNNMKQCIRLIQKMTC
jgi:hypothetical protein